VRRQVRVKYTGVGEAELLIAARHSGLAVELQVTATQPRQLRVRSELLSIPHLGDTL
jgi:hypothetical protein